MKKSMVILFIVISVIVLFILLVWITSDKSPIGHWRSVEGKREYTDSYNEVMKCLPSLSGKYDIETTFGTVRVYKWSAEATEDKNPIVLLPGRSSGAPMWGANIQDFVNARTVFALDALGDSGMSIQTSPIRNNLDQALWLEEVFEHLGISRIHLVGHSFGGWTAANYASNYPARIATLSLIEPVFTFGYIKPILILKSIPYNMKFLPKSWREGLLKEIAGTDDIDYSDPLAKMIADGTDYYISKLPAPVLIKPKQLRNWDFPVFVALGGKSALHDATLCWGTARENIRTLTGGIWEDATHSLPMEYTKEIDTGIIDFINLNDH